MLWYPNSKYEYKSEQIIKKNNDITSELTNFIRLSQSNSYVKMEMQRSFRCWIKNHKTKFGVSIEMQKEKLLPSDQLIFILDTCVRIANENDEDDNVRPLMLSFEISLVV